MKFNIEIDLNEFYAENFKSDYELGVNPTESLSSEVVSIIKHEVNCAISKQIRDDVSRIANEHYLSVGNAKIETIIEHEVSKFISIGEIRADNFSNKTIKVEDKLRQMFEGHRAWNNPAKKMEEIGKRFAGECKKRYDLHFASNIVKGLESQGLLKAGVYEALTAQDDD